MDQVTQIKNHLFRYGTITPLQAMSKYGIMRLAARIYDLREAGLRIETETVTKGNKHWARYRYYSGK